MALFLAPALLALAPVAAQTAVPPTPIAGPVAPPAGFRRGGRLFISPMGEPFRPNGRSDDGLADWFAQADVNHDGRLTLDEMQHDSERFFALLDVNHDGEIDPDEITRYETVVAPEIQSGPHFGLAAFDSDSPEGERRGGRGGRGGGRRGDAEDRSNRPGFFRNDNDQHQGAGRFGLLDLPEPVVSADADFNRGVSLNEFRSAAQQRFLALDLDHHGYLTLAGLESIRPAPPAAPKAPPRPKDPEDSALPSQG